MLLTDLKCKALKPDVKVRKVFDGGGLYLEVTTTGSKCWRLKYRFGGKENRLSLGLYPSVSLSEAREGREIAKKQLANGINPSEERKAVRLKQSQSFQNSFEVIAREWHNTKKESYTKRHAGYVIRRLEADIFPHIGSRPIDTITAPDLLFVLRIIENRGTLDVLHRALQTCGRIFRYAIVTGRADRDISIDLKGALKSRKQKNHNRLEAKELPEFLQKLKQYDGALQTKLALRLLILTFVRTSELRGAKWSEIDFDNKEWRIPAERMKMKDKHIVPLSNQSIKILKTLQSINMGIEYIFPNCSKPEKVMSENTILYAIYRMGYHSRATSHGFRATASTILNEHSFSADVIERQLAHTERNKVRASYNHAQYLVERRKMMQWWADYLDIAEKNILVK